jgi:hypothetical protein
MSLSAHLAASSPGGCYMAEKVAGIDVHKKALMVEAFSNRAPRGR